MQFVKGVVPFLKGDGQLVKGADRLKLLSKLAVFPLLLICAAPESLGLYREQGARKGRVGPSAAGRGSAAARGLRAGLRWRKLLLHHSN